MKPFLRDSSSYQIKYYYTNLYKLHIFYYQTSGIIITRSPDKKNFWKIIFDSFKMFKPGVKDGDFISYNISTESETHYIYIYIYRII